MKSMTIEDRAARAKETSRIILTQTGDMRSTALDAAGRSFIEHSDEISAANRADLHRGESEGLAAPLMKRLKFDAAKLERAVAGLQTLKAAPDPLGRPLERRELDTGLILSREAVPIGTVGFIFESRPDALVQMAALCIRSGNTLILKGGSEALETNRILTELILQASIEAGFPEGWIQLAETREDVQTMLGLHRFIDLLIPRGSSTFVSRIMKESSIPVLGHADGVCHLYLDAAADPAKAVPIAVDSKMQYIAVCNAAETLLVHARCAETLLPPVKQALEGAGCRLKGCSRTRGIIDIEAADEEDWDREYLDAVLSIRVVDSIEEAINHINHRGSGHTDAIVTEDEQAAERFLNAVDSACVFHNCSTRFSDGFVFGLGAEVGISTGKIHARGPVGVQGLLSSRWHLRGRGHLIADYSEGRASFTHKDLHP